MQYVRVLLFLKRVLAPLMTLGESSLSVLQNVHPRPRMHSFTIHQHLYMGFLKVLESLLMGKGLPAGLSIISSFESIVPRVTGKLLITAETIDNRTAHVVSTWMLLVFCEEVRTLCEDGQRLPWADPAPRI